ncbi:MAG: thermonuclease family protein [Alphaproteobacteria bacterium]|nr:thermonuclease family protein [Alphaproteobacteria bacterium]
MHRYCLLLLLLCGFDFAPTTYRAEIIRVIDGDTIEARIFIFPQLQAIYKVRLADIDTPELKGKCPQETQRAKQAKAYLQTLLPPKSEVTLHINDKFDSFGRILAQMHHDRHGNIAALLLENNHAVLYGDRVKGWCG